MGWAIAVGCAMTTPCGIVGIGAVCTTVATATGCGCILVCGTTATLLMESSNVEQFFRLSFRF